MKRQESPSATVGEYFKGTERASLAEQALSAEAQARRDAIPRLLAMGLNTEQVAEALGLSVEEVRQHSQS